MTRVDSNKNTRLHTYPIKKEVAEGHFSKEVDNKEMTRVESNDNSRYQREHKATHISY